MIVTLPLILLLLDYWPLRRIQTPFRKGTFFLCSWKNPFLPSGRHLLCDHLPGAQKNGKAVQSLENLQPGRPLCQRVACVCPRYIGKLFWPTNLAVFYPYVRHLPLMEVLASAILLLVICVVVARLARTHPPLLVGWLWFVITLIPVIGIVQAGDQALADRYTYIPSIGLFLLIVWETPHLFNGGRCEFISPLSGISLTLLAAVILSACLLVTGHQLDYWRNSVTLFSHAVQVTQKNSLAECNLGLALATEGQTNEAILHERTALQLKPNYSEAENNLGMFLSAQGKQDEAILHLLTAIKDNPQHDQPYYNLGLIYLHQGRLDDAIAQFRSAIMVNPRYDKAFVNLGIALAKQGRLDEAIDQYRHALVFAPDNPYAHNAIGRALETENQLAEAAAHYSAAIAVKPDFAGAHENLGVVLTLTENFPQAEDQFAQA